MNVKTLIIFIAVVTTHIANACPMTITNDLDETIIIVDPRGSQAILLSKQGTEMIDPTIPNPMMRYILNEKLDLYFTKEDQPNVFYKKYRLTEKYCTDDPKDNQLTVSQILQFLQKPTDRFKVEELQIVEKSSHDHKH